MRPWAQNLPGTEEVGNSSDWTLKPCPDLCWCCTRQHGLWGLLCSVAWGKALAFSKPLLPHLQKRRVTTLSI